MLEETEESTVIVEKLDDKSQVIEKNDDIPEVSEKELDDNLEEQVSLEDTHARALNAPGNDEDEDELFDDPKATEADTSNLDDPKLT